MLKTKLPVNTLIGASLLKERDGNDKHYGKVKFWEAKIGGQSKET